MRLLSLFQLLNFKLWESDLPLWHMTDIAFRLVFKESAFNLNQTIILFYSEIICSLLLLLVIFMLKALRILVKVESTT